MSGERWNYKQFRKWVEAMDYHASSGSILPYDVELIAIDLGIHPNRVRDYWRGLRDGNEVTLSPSMVLLCRCRLALKRSGDELRAICRRQPHLVDIIEPVMRMVTL